MSAKWPKFFRVLESGEDEYIVLGIVNKKQLETLAEVFDQPSRSWRGQYQAMAKAIVNACSASLEMQES